jgi:hypothetical protein
VVTERHQEIALGAGLPRAIAERRGLNRDARRASGWPEHGDGSTPCNGRLAVSYSAHVRHRLHVASTIFVIALGGCKRFEPEVHDGPPGIAFRRFDPFRPAALASAQPKPAFAALACDGKQVYGVSKLGVAVVARVPGVAANDPPVLEPLPDHVPLAAVTVSASSVVAVGPRGAIVRSAHGNSVWKQEASPITTDLHGIAATRDWIIAVGAGGTILAQPSEAPPRPWTHIASPTQEDLFAVSLCLQDDVSTKLCVVGGHGTLLVGDVTTGGVVFRPMATGTEQALRAVTTKPWGIGQGAAHAVGDRGTIVAIDNKGARLVPSGTTEDLLSVADTEIERSKLEGSFWAVVAVGKRGTVTVQGTGRNKTSSFKQLRVPTTDDLVAIVPDDHMAFVVAPRSGGLYTLALDGNARHSFPPD